jgi:hypothetical protein
MKFYLFVSTVASLSSLVWSQNGTCPLNCQDDAPCVKGDADWSDQPKDAFDRPFAFHADTNRDGWYCECPDDYTGVRCGREFQKCEGNEHFCYHGGQCIEGLDESVNATELFCDCNNAQHDGIPYVGKWCEVEAGLPCAPDSEVFCSNGGTCKDGFETKTHPCDCPDGYRGKHCEFDTGHVPECDLACENQGQCQLGIKDYDTAEYGDYWAKHDGNFQYCDCSDEFFGVKCETAGEECGSARCFNGATCLQTMVADGTNTFACDCNAANNDEDSYGGEYCQAESTTFCTKNGDTNGHLFCTNGGTCLEDT